MEDIPSYSDDQIGANGLQPVFDGVEGTWSCGIVPAGSPGHDLHRALHRGILLYTEVVAITWDHEKSVSNAPSTASGLPKRFRCWKTP